MMMNPITKRALPGMIPVSHFSFNLSTFSFQLFSHKKEGPSLPYCVPAATHYPIISDGAEICWMAVKNPRFD